MEDFNKYLEYREGNLYWKVKPSLGVSIGDRAGSINTGGYLQFGLNNKNYLVHKVIYFIHTGEWPRVIDHNDTNRLNNYFENLRPATHSQNSWNSKKRKGSSSKFKGVSRFKTKWRSTIMKTGKWSHLGYFENELDAALAYDKAAKELFGNFANINFPE